MKCCVCGDYATVLHNQACINDSFIKLMQVFSLQPTQKWTPGLRSSLRLTCASEEASGCSCHILDTACVTTQRLCCVLTQEMKEEKHVWTNLELSHHELKHRTWKFPMGVWTFLYLKTSVCQIKSKYSINPGRNEKALALLFIHLSDSGCLTQYCVFCFDHQNKVWEMSSKAKLDISSRPSVS